MLHNRLLLVLDREHPLHFACDRLAKMLGFGVLLLPAGSSPGCLEWET